MDDESIDFNEWRHFDDRASDDRSVGPARATEIKGRCANCWGAVEGRKDRDGHWIRIECQSCGRSVEDSDADREVARMQEEAVLNMPNARVGRGSKYDNEAKFVLKLLPDMDRDKAQFDRRVALSQQTSPQRNWLGRKDFPEGTPGYLYAQACAFVSGLDNFPREMSAIALSDFQFGKPQILGVEASSADTALRVSGVVPAIHRKPSNSELMARMGTCMVAGMTAAFACEVGIKAILMTRLDKAERKHNLKKLYDALPADSQERLETDFSGIADVLDENQEVFYKWRYFEERVSKDAIVALVNTDRVWGLAKAARVILDECVVAGLTYKICVSTEFNATKTDPGDVDISQRIDLSVVGGGGRNPMGRRIDCGAKRAA